MTETTEIMVKVLGMSDAIFCPVRDFGPNSWRASNAYHARRAFAEGVRLESTGDDAARKRFQKALVELTAAGLVQSSRRKIREYMRLTPAGEREARAVCGLEGMASAWMGCTELARLSKRTGKTMTSRWVSELLMGSVEDRIIVEIMLLPAIVAGYVVSNSTAHGLAHYMLAREGWAWLDGPAPPPDPPHAPDVDARALYFDVVKSELHRLGSGTPTDSREIGYLPLPCSMDGILFSGD